MPDISGRWRCNLPVQMHPLAMSRCIPPSFYWSSCRTDLSICMSACLVEITSFLELLDELA